MNLPRWKKKKLMSHRAATVIVTRKATFFLALASGLLCSTSLGQDALQLFQKMQNALGGADKIAAIHDFEDIVRADAWHEDGRSMGVVRKRVRFVRPSYLRIDQVGREDTYVLYFDGTGGWEILPNGSVVDLAGDELKFAQNYAWHLNLNLWLADRNPECTITSPAPNVLLITDKSDPSLKEELTLDAKTFLPTNSGSLSDWHPSAGVKFPQQISNFHNGKKVAAITVEQTRINQGLKLDDLSVKPPDRKPVMPPPLVCNREQKRRRFV